MARPKSRDVTRSEKVMFYLTPETFQQFKKLAHINEMSMNEFCCSLVEEAVKKNSEKIAEFNMIKSM